MTALVRYDVACRAIARALAVDEVKEIRSKAEAMRCYARQAKNKQLEIEASEIRFRAERRLGQLMESQRDAGALKPGRPASGEMGSAATHLPGLTLAAAGIDKHMADRARKLAAIPEPEFESLLGVRRKAFDKENQRITIDLLAAGDKAERRAAREAELAQKIVALPSKRYGVIVADPEWRFEPWSRETGLDRAADNHYPTSCTEVIAARDVPSIAAEDCALFLWGTVPMLPHALLVMSAWGFEYKSNFLWAKDRLGTGYWNRNVHEHLLLGIKGHVPCPSPGEQWESLQYAPVGGHSEKPELFLELVEHYFPTLPKIELNRRGPARPGWDAWGNEAEDCAA